MTDLPKFDQVSRALDAFAKYLLLVNTGGAVATLAFIGSVLAADRRLSVSVASVLTFFILGVVVTGFIHLARYRVALNELATGETEALATEWRKMSDEMRTLLVTLIASFTFFIFGAIGGIIILSSQL